MQDLLACHRLGRLIGRGGTLLEMLVSLRIDDIASQGDLVFLDRAKATPKQLESYMRELQALPSLPSISEKIDVTERFFFLDRVMMVDRRGIDSLNFVDNKKFILNRYLKLVDWDPALRNGNQWYDRMVEVSRGKDRAVRTKKWEELVSESRALENRTTAFVKRLENIGKGEEFGKALGKEFGDIWISQLVPRIAGVPRSEDRGRQVQDNLLIAFALARYRADHGGKYPKDLAELAPKYLKEIPGDLFSGKGLIYRTTEKGYLLYSVGRNGLDEEGRKEGDDPRGDDLSVRMPLPELSKKQR